MAAGVLHDVLLRAVEVFGGEGGGDVAKGIMGGHEAHGEVVGGEHHGDVVVFEGAALGQVLGVADKVGLDARDFALADRGGDQGVAGAVEDRVGGGLQGFELGVGVVEAGAVDGAVGTVAGDELHDVSRGAGGAVYQFDFGDIVAGELPLQGREGGPVSEEDEARRLVGGQKAAQDDFVGDARGIAAGYGQVRFHGNCLLGCQCFMEIACGIACVSWPRAICDQPK